MEQVHFSVTRIVKPGMEEAFEQALRTFVRQSLHEKGTIGVHLVSSVPGVDGREYRILRSFESEDARQAFHASSLYARWETHVADLVIGEPIVRRLNGLEAFFRDTNTPPPRWKMAIVTWIGVCFTVYAVTLMLTPPTQHWPWFLKFITLNGGVVAGLTWVVMPVLGRLFAAWLFPHPNNTT